MKEDESFIDTYLKYTAKQESPEMFHLWVAITILAATMGRKCFMDKGFYRLYPNFFTVLVAGSAKCRKSTSIALGVNLLQEIGIGTGLLKDVPGVQIVSGKITPEKFIDEIADSREEGTIDAPIVKAKGSVLVHASELSVFLTKQSYGEALIQILTDLFDCPAKWPYKTKHQGSFYIVDAFLCILAATTPDGLSRGINESALHEGLGSRTMWIYQRDTPRRNPFPRLSPEEVHLYERLKHLLIARSRLEGEFKLTDAAMRWYTEWYNQYMDSLPPDKRAEGMYGRKHDQLLRLGMVYSGSYGLQHCDTHHLQAAEMTLDAAEINAMAAFSSVGGDETTPHLERMISILRRYKRVSHSELLRRMFPVNARLFAVLIDTLIQAGLVKQDAEIKRIYEWIGD